MKKRTCILSGGILAASLLFSGCQPIQKANSPEDNPVSITVWTYYNGEQLASFNRLVRDFNDTIGKEKGIYVESFSQGTVTDLENNVIAAAKGKVGAPAVPNIFAAYADTAFTFDQMGLAVNLSDYLTEEEQELYIDSYLEEGRFTGDHGIRIFPTAKSIELFLLNRTDWTPFAEATGASYEDLSTLEGVTATAQAYYEWTDSLTEEPDDGKAFFGRDAMANYFLIGGMQLGTELFHAEDGVMTLDFDKQTIRTLWDNYYVPTVKGYFASFGRFRSDDVKTGSIISFVGSSSGATFFPGQVIINDTESYSIELDVLPAPRFRDGAPYAVQQGAGMVVTPGDEDKIRASVEFLKWFTAPEQNIEFSIDSGYLPVTKAANQMETIRASHVSMNSQMEKILTTAVDTVNHCTLYTPKAFIGGTTARSILEHSMSDAALADRTAVEEAMAAGMSMEEAAAPYLTDEHFDAWYEHTLQALQDANPAPAGS